MVFRNGGIVKQMEKWFYQGTEIETVLIYKYIRLYFTPKLIWTKTKQRLAMRLDSFKCFPISKAIWLFQSN